MSSKAYFEDVAGQWDTMRAGFFPDNLRDRAFKAANLKAGDLASDIGAGTGFLTAALIKKGVRVIAVDQSPAMLEQLKTNFADNDLIETRVGESESLPIEDESVNAVLANMFLHHVERPAETIREMARTLKPGGRLVITDLDEHTNEFLRTEQHDRWLGFKRQDIQAWFEQAGLTGVTVDCTDENCCSASTTTDDTADVSVFIAVGEKPAAGESDVHRAVREHYASLARSSSSCCGPAEDSCGCDDTSYAVEFYDSDQLGDLPGDVTGMSLGCGDPVTIASLKPGETVLDLGSGAGLDCFLSARQVGKTGRVIGVDMTPDMIAKAEASRDKLGLNQVEFRQGYIEAIPGEDGIVDVIMSNCVINLSPDKAAVFSESFRVLKPGGRISFSDIVTEGEFSETDRANLDSWAACVSGAIDVNEYTRLLKATGFVDVQVVDKSLANDPQAGEPHVYQARITAVKPLS